MLVCNGTSDLMCARRDLCAPLSLTAVASMQSRPSDPPLCLKHLLPIEAQLHHQLQGATDANIALTSDLPSNASLSSRATALTLRLTSAGAGRGISGHCVLRVKPHAHGEGTWLDVGTVQWTDALSLSEEQQARLRTERAAEQAQIKADWERDRRTVVRWPLALMVGS